MPTKFYGETLDPNLVKQLEARSKLISRDFGEGITTDFSRVQKFLNSRGSWIRLISGVNEKDPISIPDEKEADSYTNLGVGFIPARIDNTRVFTTIYEPEKALPLVLDTPSNSNLAKKFILSGGELEWDGQKFIPRIGVNLDNTNSDRKLYNYSSVTGLSPTPGITSFEIRNIGNFGAVRKATISFVVWSIEDFNNVEKIFFRPGFSVIVEWGNSIYPENDVSNNAINIKETTIPDTLGNYQKFFNPDSTGYDFFYEIQEKAVKSLEYNYDSFIGLITNFNWSLRQDGGYDCKIDVVSRGSVLDSLTLKGDVRKMGDALWKFKEASDEEDRNKYKSIFHNINSLRSGDKPRLVYYQDTSLEYPITPEFDFTKNLRGHFQQVLNSSYSEFNKVHKNELGFYEIPRIPLPDEFDIKNSSTTFRYIPLKLILKLLNVYYLPKSPTKKESTDSTEYIVKFTPKREHKFLTFDDHLSFNPTVCILAKGPREDKWPAGRIIGITDETSSLVLEELLGLGTGNYTDSDSIGNILVNLRHVESVAESILSTDEIDKSTVLNFLKTLLRDVSTALGGINEFDIQNLGDGNFDIVDRANTTGIDVAEIPILSLTGTKSIFYNIDVSSNISSEIGAQISISTNSAGNADNSPQTNLSMLEWNRDYVDRFKKNTTTLPTIESTQNDWEQKIAFMTKVFDLYLNLSGGNDKLNEETPQFSGDTAVAGIDSFIKFISDRLSGNESEQAIVNFRWDLITEIKDEAILRTKQAVLTEKLQTKQSIPGLIPIRLGMELDGVGGISIAQVFKVDIPLLPDIYNEFSYIITGLEHSIGGDNKWITKVTALPFAYKPSTAGVNDEDKPKTYYPNWYSLEP